MGRKRSGRMGEMKWDRGGDIVLRSVSDLDD